jgi:hypothetical protein
LAADGSQAPEVVKGLIFLPNYTFMENATKRFKVSCFNKATDVLIYRTKIDAEDSLHARILADNENQNKLIKVVCGTVRRYLVEPVEAA